MAARAGSRRVFAFLAGVMLLASTASSAVGQSPPDASRFTATPLEPTGTIVGDFSKAVVRGGNVGVIVKLKDASVASYRGGVNNMKATNPAARGAKTLDLKSKDLTTYRNYLKGKQDAFSARLSGVKGAKVTGNFDLVLNAVSAVVPSSELATIANMPGVATIYPDSLLKLETDVSPQFIGAPTVWSSLGGQQSAGEGVIVGVLDTGIWPEHASYSDPDPSGKPYAAPPAAPDGSRACEFTGGANPGPAFTCNNKLIGADRRMATYDAVIGLLPGEFTTRSGRQWPRHPYIVHRGRQRRRCGHDLRRRPRHHLGCRPASPRRDVQGLRRSGLLRLRLGQCGPGRDRRRRQRHQLLDQRRRQPLLRCRRARLPRCLQRGRLRGGVGRQLRSRRRDHRPPRAVGRRPSAPARRTERSSTASTSRPPEGRRCRSPASR